MGVARQLDLFIPASPIGHLDTPPSAGVTSPSLIKGLVSADFFLSQLFFTLCLVRHHHLHPSSSFSPVFIIVYSCEELWAGLSVTTWRVNSTAYWKLGAERLQGTRKRDFTSTEERKVFWFRVAPWVFLLCGQQEGFFGVVFAGFPLHHPHHFHRHFV